MPSIVRLCWYCHGYPESGPGGQCWNCIPSRHAPYHPGPGYTLEARRASEYPVGAVIVDVYRGERMEIVARLKSGLRMRRLADGLDLVYAEDQPRYLTPEEFADPETWRLPIRDKQRQTATISARQGVLL